ncbi:hypothetical protein KEM54_006996 [Ascosphaera aggregata]|nr:hypothetical protein KEM54_006996 [Ascosphaera aggregata]
MAAAKSGTNLRSSSKPRGSRSSSPFTESAHGEAVAKPVEGYGSVGVKDNDALMLPASDYKIMLAITAVATFIRLFRIYQPSSVVFDEVHFGGFARKYIKGQFFMDVHPPLAKLLITLVGWLSGYDGNFDFKEIGKDYVEARVPYVSMRMLSAILGILAVPTMFLTLKSYGCRTSTASMGAILVTFENGLITQSRLILLDSPLIICTALTALAFVNFSNQHEQGPPRAFGSSWWFWLVLSGVFLGLTASIKWVGLFTIAWVGSLTILQLWVLLGDTKTTSAKIWFKHFVARALCLIVIPVSIYLGMFAIHFICLRNPGEGDGFMSSEFQATLNHKGMIDTPADVVFGSRLTIRHVNTQGGYLHSHENMYPEGSKQQQITLYPHKDENNIWVVENQTQPLDAEGNPIPGPRAWDEGNLTFVENGALIRLYHPTTHRRLHSHDDHRPPVSDADWQNEVTAYGYEGFEGDANDLFRVVIVKSRSQGKIAKERLRPIHTKFKLVHVITGCSLFSHKVKLPAWGFEQQEVTCAKQGILENSLWYIEQNDHPLLGPDVEKVNYNLPGFFAKFWELHKVMWQTNAGLTESHSWESRPSSWPLLRRGINFWNRDYRQVYLLGNPVIWWLSTAAVAVYILFKCVAILRWQRSCGDYEHVNFRRFDYELGQTVLGWAFHYFPFYLMARQLFLHHYFPALYFSIMAFCQVFDFAANRVRLAGTGKKASIVGKAFIAFFVTLSVVAYLLLSPLVYGNAWTQRACQKVKILDSWDFHCNTYHEEYSHYNKVEAVSTIQASIAASPSESSAEAAPVLQQQEQNVIAANISPVAASEDSKAEVSQSWEYRDENGRLLTAEEIAALEDSDDDIEYHMNYETRSLMKDGSYVVIGSSQKEKKVVKAEERKREGKVQVGEREEKGGDTAEETVAEKQQEEEAHSDQFGLKEVSSSSTSSELVGETPESTEGVGQDGEEERSKVHEEL